MSTGAKKSAEVIPLKSHKFTIKNRKLVHTVNRIDRILFHFPTNWELDEAQEPSRFEWPGPHGPHYGVWYQATRIEVPDAAAMKSAEAGARVLQYVVLYPLEVRFLVGTNSSDKEEIKLLYSKGKCTYEADIPLGRADPQSAQGSSASDESNQSVQPTQEAPSTPVQKSPASPPSRPSIPGLDDGIFIYGPANWVYIFKVLLVGEAGFFTAVQKFGKAGIALSIDELGYEEEITIKEVGSPLENLSQVFEYNFRQKVLKKVKLELPDLGKAAITDANRRLGELYDKVEIELASDSIDVGAVFVDKARGIELKFGTELKIKGEENGAAADTLVDHIEPSRLDSASGIAKLLAKWSNAEYSIYVEAKIGWDVLEALRKTTIPDEFIAPAPNQSGSDRTYKFERKCALLLKLKLDLTEFIARRLFKAVATRVGAAAGRAAAARAAAIKALEATGTVAAVELAAVIGFVAASIVAMVFLLRLLAEAKLVPRLYEEAYFGRKEFGLTVARALTGDPPSNREVISHPSAELMREAGYAWATQLLVQIGRATNLTAEEIFHVAEREMGISEQAEQLIAHGLKQRILSEARPKLFDSSYKTLTILFDGETWKGLGNKPSLVDTPSLWVDAALKYIENELKRTQNKRMEYERFGFGKKLLQCGGEWSPGGPMYELEERDKALVSMQTRLLMS